MSNASPPRAKKDWKTSTRFGSNEIGDLEIQRSTRRNGQMSCRDHPVGGFNSLEVQSKGWTYTYLKLPTSNFVWSVPIFDTTQFAQSTKQGRLLSNPFNEVSSNVQLVCSSVVQWGRMGSTGIRMGSICFPKTYSKSEKNKHISECPRRTGPRHPPNPSPFRRSHRVAVVGGAELPVVDQELRALSMGPVSSAVVIPCDKLPVYGWNL